MPGFNFYPSPAAEDNLLSYCPGQNKLVNRSNKTVFSKIPWSSWFLQTLKFGNISSPGKKLPSPVTGWLRPTALEYVHPSGVFSSRMCVLTQFVVASCLHLISGWNTT